VNINSCYTTNEVFCEGTQWCGGLIGWPEEPLLGTNTWVNHTTDTATGCVGQSGTLSGASFANCDP